MHAGSKVSAAGEIEMGHNASREVLAIDRWAEHLIKLGSVDSI